MQGRMALNRDQIDECRKLARQVAEHLQKNTERHTTLAVEQAVLRAMGAASAASAPIIHEIAKKIGVPALKLGVAGWVGRVMVARKLSPEKAALYLASHGLGNRDALNEISWSQAQHAARDAVNVWVKTLSKPANGRPRNGHFRTAVQLGAGSATQDLSAIHRLQGKMDMAVVNVPAPPSPFDGVPTERRRLLRRSGYPFHHTVQRLATDTQDLDVCFDGCGVPEAAVIAATGPRVRLGVDPVSLIRHTHIDPHKAFIDYAFMNQVSAKTGLPLHNDLSKWDAPEFLDTHIHQVLAMQIVMEQWMIQSGGALDRRVLVLPSLTHGKVPQDVTAVLANAQLYRELFAQSEIWQHVSVAQPAWDVSIASLTGFTGAVVPKTSSTMLSSVKEWGQAVKPLAYECEFSDHGHISRRMHTLLERCMKELTRLYRTGFIHVMVQDHGGLFAMGKSEVGSDSVLEKDRRYWNPVDEYLGR